jgi:hypothetical protein
LILTRIEPVEDANLQWFRFFIFVIYRILLFCWLFFVSSQIR